MKYFIIGICCLIIGYIISIFFPFNAYFSLSQEAIPPAIFHQNIIAACGVIATTAAVVVALFSRKIDGWLHKPELKHSFHPTSIIEATDDSTGRKLATSYHSTIRVTNDGNGNATDCYVSLDKILFKEDGTQDYIDLQIIPSNIDWKLDNKITYISSGRFNDFEVFILEIEEISSTPDVVHSASPTLLGKLKIGNYPINTKDKGDWIAEFSVNSSCSKPKTIKINIHWSGKVVDRLTDMGNHLTVNIEK